MTGPVQGVYTLRCESCNALAYSSDTAPPADPRAELNRFANTRCPRAGVGCPHTDSAREERAERQPEQLRHRVRELRDDVRAARIRTRKIQFPVVVANAQPVEIAITWGQPFADDRYVIGVEVGTPIEWMGLLNASIKYGSVTPTGFVLLVSAAVNVTAGQARIHLMAAP